MTIKNNLLLLITIITLGLSSCKDDKIETPAENGAFTLEFENTVNGNPLVLNNQNYTNANGDNFSISAFNYYIGNVVLTKEDGSIYKLPESYMSIDAAKPTSLLNSITGIPASDYTQISFDIISVKLEGSSPQSTAINNHLTFHVGGNAAIRTYTKALATSSPLRIRDDKKPQMHFKVNAASLFTGKQNISFANLNFTENDAKSIIIADNYLNGLFQSVHIHN